MKSLKKENLVEVLQRWTTEGSVVVPTRTPQGDILFDTFDPKTLALDCGKVPLPPKSVCFPQHETTFAVKDGAYAPGVSAPKVVLFGLRACDLMGLRQSHAFMTRDRDDVYFSSRRDNVLTAVLACPGRQNATCFCTTTRSGPWAEAGFDVQLYDVGDSFLVQAGTPAGERLVAGELFRNLDAKAAEERLREFRRRATDDVAKVPAVEQAIARLKDGAVKDEVWETFGKKCIVCGGCTFVCPTCTCFNVTDHVASPGNGIRFRSWDACLFAGFTRETSGHNPRPTQGTRLQRRHEHKLRHFHAGDVREGLCGCVGCGRCSDYCPVHIGTLEVVKAIVG